MKQTNRIVLIMGLTGVLVAPLALAITHPAGAHCVTYEAKGMAGTGTITRCTDGANRSFETTDVKVGLGPFKKREHKHTITKGERIYTVQFKQKRVLSTVNPMYQAVTESSTDARDLNQRYLDAFDFSPTGEEERVADAVCAVYQAPLLGSVCMTDDLIVLKQSAPGSTQVAVEVVRGSAGEAHLYDETAFGFPIEEGPDLGKIMSGVSEHMQQSMEQSTQ